MNRGEGIPTLNHKSALYELCQKRHLTAPQITSSLEGGAAHTPLFSASVKVCGNTYYSGDWPYEMNSTNSHSVHTPQQKGGRKRCLQGCPPWNTTSPGCSNSRSAAGELQREIIWIPSKTTRTTPKWTNLTPSHTQGFETVSVPDLLETKFQSTVVFHHHSFSATSNTKSCPFSIHVDPPESSEQLVAKQILEVLKDNLPPEKRPLIEIPVKQLLDRVLQILVSTKSNLLFSNPFFSYFLRSEFRDPSPKYTPVNHTSDCGWEVRLDLPLAPNGRSFLSQPQVKWRSLEFWPLSWRKKMQRMMQHEEPCLISTN